ncbi:hypothetical protein C5167_037377 [Papaver somniferum]|uniref:Uncharacterized protein n=1 Tax=Papaver somniferum TaxID=3469 RepID=A0A4Y7IA94_PAPSO|nr:hypothetical protein C5167_037377 [Papaver somniferum]
MSTITTANRSRFFNARGNSSSVESRVRSSKSTHGCSSSGKVDSMAMWFINDEEDNFQHQNRGTGGIRRRRNGKGKTIDDR